MPAPLSLASATVTDDQGGEIAKKATLTVRGTTLRLAGVEYPDVSSVTSPGRGRWTIRFVTGDEFHVQRVGGCGCGGRR